MPHSGHTVVLPSRSDALALLGNLFAQPAMVLDSLAGAEIAQLEQLPDLDFVLLVMGVGAALYFGSVRSWINPGSTVTSNQRLQNRQMRDIFFRAVAQAIAVPIVGGRLGGSGKRQASFALPHARFCALAEIEDLSAFIK